MLCIWLLPSTVPTLRADPSPEVHTKANLSDNRCKRELRCITLLVALSHSRLFALLSATFPLCISLTQPRIAHRWVLLINIFPTILLYGGTLCRGAASGPAGAFSAAHEGFSGRGVCSQIFCAGKKYISCYLTRCFSLFARRLTELSREEPWSALRRV